MIYLGNINLMIRLKSINTRKSTGASFLDGEHYLVDALGNLLKVKENGDPPIFIPNQLKKV